MHTYTCNYDRNVSEKDWGGGGGVKRQGLQLMFSKYTWTIYMLQLQLNGFFLKKLYFFFLYMHKIEILIIFVSYKLN